MSAFLDKLWLEDVNGRDWIVAAPFRYHCDLPECRGVLTVPAGTRTNLASIPRIVWTVLPASGKWNPAAVLHDAGYNGQLVTEHGERIHLVKPICDKLFLDAMRVAGVNGVLAKLMYRMVSAFGNTDPNVA